MTATKVRRSSQQTHRLSRLQLQAADRRQGQPAFFIAHGTRDQVLPTSRTSRRLVPALRRDGYDVTYQEFDGEHSVP